MTKRAKSETIPERRNPRSIAWILVAALLIHPTTLPVFSQSVQETPPKTLDLSWLEKQKPVERDMTGGQTHSYQLSLTAGQYAYVQVKQMRFDVLVNIFGPDGKFIADVDDPIGMQGIEPVHIIAESTGVYRLDVIAVDNNARPGRYEAKLVEIRPGTQQDRDGVTADRKLYEGGLLIQQGTSDARKAAIKIDLEALSIYRAIGAPSREFTALLVLGYLHMYEGENQKALEYTNQAALTAQALNDKYRHGVALDLVRELYRLMGEFEKALLAGEEGLRLYRAAESPENEITMLRSIANIYSLLGEHEKARDYYRRIIPLYQSLGDKTGEATTLYSLGTSFDLEDDHQKALEYWNQSLEMFQALGNKFWEPGLHGLISNEYARLGERQKALAHASLALQLRVIGHSSEAGVMSGVGSAYYRLGDYEKALSYQNEALRIRQASGDKRGEALALKHIAVALRDQGRLAEAQISIEKCIALLESIRSSVTSPELRASFLASLFEYYEIHIDLMMRLHAANPKRGHDLEALAFTEKVKLRSLVELLSNGSVDLRQGVDGTLLDREQNLNKRLTTQLDAITKLLSVKYTDAQKIAAERELDGLKAELRLVQTQIREHSPRYAALTEPQPLSVAEIQQQLLDDNTILLEYELGDERSYLWAVTVNGVSSYSLPPRAEVEAQARRVYEILIARQPTPGLTDVQQRAREVAADARYTEQASVLSDMLLKPVAAQLGTKRLLIVSDGTLQYLPFSVLPAPATQATTTKRTPLVLDHEIVNLPSASVLAVLRREFANRKAAPKTVAVLADPVFEGNDARVKASLAATKKRDIQSLGAQTPVSTSDQSAKLKRAIRSVRGDDEAIKLQRLLFSRDEAESILSAVSPQQSGLKALDFRANRATAMSSELGQYRIIHFSTHGLLDSRHPELSGLVLSLVDEAGQSQEGFLRLHEIYNLRLNADLVVLSACQTGLGKDVKGEGLIGLVRGFMYAGSPRVMASMWQVDDAATAALMKRFYRGMLREKLPAAAALRAAQIEMIKSKHWQSPYYWGAFTLQGEWK